MPRTTQGLWVNDQEWRDQVIAQLIYLRTAIYFTAFVVSVVFETFGLPKVRVLVRNNRSLRTWGYFSIGPMLWPIRKHLSSAKCLVKIQYDVFADFINVILLVPARANLKRF
jgi:hypothetical protein